MEFLQDYEPITHLVIKICSVLLRNKMDVDDIADLFPSDTNYMSIEEF